MSAGERAVLLGFALIVVLSGYMAVHAFNSRRMNDFCESVPMASSREDMLRIGAEAGFVYLESSEHVSVLSHNAPFFRYTCSARFKGGKITEKKVFSSD